MVSHFDFTEFRCTDAWDSEENVDRIDLGREGRRKRGEVKAD